MPKDSVPQYVSIHDIPTREQGGRDAISRFDAQIRAAAIFCLLILKRQDVDRVYCDYHDDFVVRKVSGGNFIYDFYQVKTQKKKKHIWNSNELLGIQKRTRKPENQDVEKVTASFIGKLLTNAIKFNEACGAIIFQTNVHLDDEIEDLDEVCRKQSFSKNNRCLLILKHNFKDALYSEDFPLSKTDIDSYLSKLQFQAEIEYLHPNYEDSSFEARAMKDIYEFSEVNLNYTECKDIVDNLLRIVHKKSSGIILETLSPSEIDEACSIDISDLLEILSISKTAYETLIQGGDSSAIKTVSILQRKLKQNGLTDGFVDYACALKVKWDDWQRDYRHTIEEMDYNFLFEKIHFIFKEWRSGQISFDNLDEAIRDLAATIAKKGIVTNLTNELLLGAVFAEYVRNESL